MSPMLVYLVSMHDYAPEGVFSTLEAAQEFATGDLEVIGPYKVDDPDADLPNWYESEARA